MVRYQLKDKPIYVDVYQVREIGELHTEQEPEVSLDDFRPSTYIKFDGKLGKLKRYTLEFQPYRIVTLEDGFQMPMLEEELQGITVGTYLKYDVNTDKYTPFEPEKYPALIVCE